MTYRGELMALEDMWKTQPIVSRRLNVSSILWTSYFSATMSSQYRRSSSNKYGRAYYANRIQLSILGLCHRGASFYSYRIFSRIFPIFHRMSGMAISIFDSLPLDWNTIGCLSLNFVIGFLAFHASWHSINYQTKRLSAY